MIFLAKEKYFFVLNFLFQDLKDDSLLSKIEEKKMLFRGNAYQILVDCDTLSKQKIFDL